MKRTTGIPRSFLKTVDKPTAIANDGTVDETKQPTGVMINADGEWVIAEPDKASWDQYQARARISAAAQEAAARGNKELQERGLECSIDKRLFVEPSKTPCCQTTYCLECITNALLENDLRCPRCNTENILLDDLKPDKQMVQRIQEYENEQQSSQSPEGAKSPGSGMSGEKTTLKKESTEERQATPKPAVESPLKSKITATEARDGSTSPPSVAKDNCSKKRPADSPLENTRTQPPPGTEATKQRSQMPTSNNANPSFTPSAGNAGLAQTVGPMGVPAPNNLMNMPMRTMPSMPSMPVAMGPYTPMTMMNPFMAGSNGNWNGMWNAGFPQQPFNMVGGAFPNAMSNGPFGAPNMQMPMNNGYPNSAGMNANGSGRGTFSNQQRNHFAGSKANEEDSPYFRKPVNPHRHQARRNVSRPADYREI